MAPVNTRNRHSAAAAPQTAVPLHSSVSATAISTAGRKSPSHWATARGIPKSASALRDAVTSTNLAMPAVTSTAANASLSVKSSIEIAPACDVDVQFEGQGTACSSSGHATASTRQWLMPKHFKPLGHVSRHSVHVLKTRPAFGPSWQGQTYASLESQSVNVLQRSSHLSVLRHRAHAHRVTLPASKHRSVHARTRSYSENLASSACAWSLCGPKWRWSSSWKSALLCSAADSEKKLFSLLVLTKICTPARGSKYASMSIPENAVQCFGVVGKRSLKSAHVTVMFRKVYAQSTVTPMSPALKRCRQSSPFPTPSQSAARSCASLRQHPAVEIFSPTHPDD